MKVEGRIRETNVKNNYFVTNTTGKMYKEPNYYLGK